MRVAMRVRRRLERFEMQECGQALGGRLPLCYRFMESETDQGPHQKLMDFAHLLERQDI